ncbi:MAG: hypothetical protein R6U98_08260, partial [Pirellulaceae bacterium]
SQLAGDPALYLRFPGKEHRYCNRVCGGTLVVDRHATRDLRFDESVAKGADTRFLQQVRKAGLKIYSADIYNFFQVRQMDPGTHTWDIGREEYLRTCTEANNQWDDTFVFL